MPETREVSFDIRKVALENYIVSVRLTHMREFRFRLWVAKHLLVLASKIAGAWIKIEVDEPGERSL